ncbi:hypothetical protein E2C01_057532 [Portunus trituberculatus]|uniref:Uncharacterized protein n=1 Tax=Portunus trituberculatus TaxID=210409 RepID=A0A5B7H3L5_PORTR|nr:hypothetical protein [Portunus trituberculatus]
MLLRIVWMLLAAGGECGRIQRRARTSGVGERHHSHHYLREDAVGDVYNTTTNSTSLLQELYVSVNISRPMQCLLLVAVAVVVVVAAFLTLVAWRKGRQRAPPRPSGHENSPLTERKKCASRPRLSFTSSHYSHPRPLSSSSARKPIAQPEPLCTFLTPPDASQTPYHAPQKPCHSHLPQDPFDIRGVPHSPRR